MTIFLSNFFLIFTIFFSKNFYIFYLKNKGFDLKKNNIIWGFISINVTKNFVLPSSSSKYVDLVKQIDLFIPKETEATNLPCYFPQKGKSFLPGISKNSTQLIKKYYPKSVLQVKQNQNILNVESKDITLVVFDEKIIIGFAIFCLFSFFIYNFFKNKFVLKQKLNTKLFRKIDLFLKKDFLLKLKERFFSKLLENLEQFFKAQIRLKLKSLYKVSVWSSSTLNVSSLFFNEFVYSEKVNENREQNSLTFSCKHYFLDVKKNDVVVLTRDFPTLFLSAGMEGIVNRVVLHQQLEVTFFTTTNLPEMIPKILLFKYQTSLVKKEDLFF